eukprot:15722966-Heterocapsa_arctica.AAC.1
MEAFRYQPPPGIPGPDPPMPAPVPRQIKITTEMLEKFGYTANCVRCSGLGRGPAPTSAREPHCR